MNIIFRTAFLLVLIQLVSCDLPTNCTYEDTVGKWMLYLGKANQTNKINCKDTVEPVKTLKIQLIFPNVVVDEYGNEGTWTMVYNQG